MTLSTPQPMPRDQLRAVATRWISQIQRGGDVFGMMEVAAHPDIVVHLPDGATGGLDSWRQYGAILRTAFPDLTAALESLTVADDRILMQMELQGTQTGPLDVVAPTNRQVTSPAATVTRLDETGRIVEMWVYLNMAAAIFRQ
jgi:predicted ester cyclase